MLAFLLAAQLISTSPYSHDPPLRKMGTAEQLLDDCRKAVRAEDNPSTAVDKQLVELIESQRCDRFLMGAWGMHEMLVATRKLERQFCVPLEVPLSKVRRAIAYHSLEYRGTKLNDVNFVVLAALQEEFPCKDKK